MEKNMPAHEKAIVRAINKYFENAPSGLKPAKKDLESSIMNAFHRYFVTKDKLS